MKFTHCCISLEVTDVNGREISYHTDKITDVQQLICVLEAFVHLCRNSKESRKRTCGTRSLAFIDNEL